MSFSLKRVAKEFEGDDPAFPIRGVIGSGKSSVAAAIASSQPGFAVVDVDSVKIQNPKNRGNAMNCVPHEDFPEAGHQADQLRKQGLNVIVTECFADKDHIDLFLGPTGRNLSSPDVSVFWFMSDLKVVLERKKGERPVWFVKRQHKRHKTRFIVPGEKIIDTTSNTSDQVAREVLETLGV
jgi:hypothetical protein